MKLIYPLDFQLRVSAGILVDVSLSFAFQRQRVLALYDCIYSVLLVLRIAACTWPRLAQTIVYKINKVTGAIFQTIEMYPVW